MKKIALISMMAFASVAFADGGGMGGHYSNNNGHGGGGQQQSSPSLEATILMNTAVINSASGRDGISQQNLASNVGDFTNGNTQVQLVYAKDSYIKSEASWGGQAQQNIESTRNL